MGACHFVNEGAFPVQMLEKKGSIKQAFLCVMLVKVEAAP